MTAYVRPKGKMKRAMILTVQSSYVIVLFFTLSVMCRGNVRMHVPILQYRHLIPAPVNGTSASAWLYYHPWITCQ